jgi:hypothetical protein
VADRRAGAARWPGSAAARPPLARNGVSTAALELAGDAVSREGTRGGGLALVALGFVVPGSHGLATNLPSRDFSRLLGA